LFKVSARQLQALVAWIGIGLGLAVVAGSLAWVGLGRSLGQSGRGLEVRGPYRFSRNPQIVGECPLILGYVLLWPSWYAFGWAFLYAALAHMMVLSEEEHLMALFGATYRNYCRVTPRYIHKEAFR
jgi:protein-S-isoprenylcysteine O-methyltransferase Ste14